jgi:hypothetical protein
MAAQPLLDHAHPAGDASARPRRCRPSGEEHSARQTARRRVKALGIISAVSAGPQTLEVPPPVVEVVPRKRGVAPKLPAAAFELARQVYFLQHGTMRQCARAVIASGLSDSNDTVIVTERLKTWWAREEWPSRSTLETFRLRDANHDGGLYRGTRTCVGEATGSGPAPKGKQCTQTALPDSDYCYHHDPREEYVQARIEQAKLLAAARRADMVDIAPLRAWMEHERVRLLEQARAGGRVHPNNTGWGLLATAINVDLSVIGRMMKGTHNGGAARAGRGPTNQIRASTVVRYLEPTSTTFRDIYGFEPPARGHGGAHHTCPQCGERKYHQSKLCRNCHEGQGVQCSYVNTAGRRCRITTTHASGCCFKCRQIVERDHKPRTGRPTWVSAPMLILAAGEYSEQPNLAWVARRMWAENAAGVREVFKSQKSLASGLVKQFRKREITSVAAARAMQQALIAEHGAIAWPQGTQAVELEVAGLVPFVPFKAWLAERVAELGSYSQLAQRIHMNPDNISKWLRGVVEKTTVRRATVDQALSAFGAGTTFADLYLTEASP